jgi:hypothetical protein
MERIARHRTALAATLTACLFASAACSNPGAPLGGDCLRNDDCAEGACVALRCRLQPTDPAARTSGGVNAYTPPASDAGAPAPADAGAPVPADAGAADAGASGDDAAAPEADASTDAGQ